MSRDQPEKVNGKKGREEHNNLPSKLTVSVTPPSLHLSRHSSWELSQSDAPGEIYNCGQFIVVIFK